jgi:hypothetical protein
MTCVDVRLSRLKKFHPASEAEYKLILMRNALSRAEFRFSTMHCAKRLPGVNPQHAAASSSRSQHFVIAVISVHADSQHGQGTARQSTENAIFDNPVVITISLDNSTHADSGCLHKSNELDLQGHSIIR